MALHDKDSLFGFVKMIQGRLDKRQRMLDNRQEKDSVSYLDGLIFLQEQELFILKFEFTYKIENMQRASSSSFLRRNLFCNKKTCKVLKETLQVLMLAV
jgi:hypothetical protein